jgi:hypothetical protein
LEDNSAFKSIYEALMALPKRIKFITELRKKIISDLSAYDIVHRQELGFVVVIKYKDEAEKKQLIDYCNLNKFPFTQCPRYIRLNNPAISIEVKQLQE